MSKFQMVQPKHGDKGHKFWHTSFWLQWDVARKVEAAARAGGVSTSEAVHQILEQCVGQFPAQAGKSALEPSMRGVVKKAKPGRKPAKKVKATAKKATKKVVKAVKAADNSVRLTAAQRAAKNKKDKDRRAAKKRAELEGTKVTEVPTPVQPPLFVEEQSASAP